MRLYIPRPGLQLKIVAWSFIPAAIILLGVGLFSFFLLQVAVERAMIESNRETTELMAEQIKGEFVALADQLKEVARATDLLAEDINAPRAALQRATSTLENFDGGVVVLNRQGRVVAARPAEENLQADWSDRPVFRQMVESPGMILSDIHSERTPDNLVVTLFVPILDGDRRLVGAVAGMLRVDSTGASTLNRRFTRFRTWPVGYHLLDHPDPESTYLVDHNGWIVFHTDPAQVGRNISSETAVRSVLAGGPGPVSSAEFTGNPVLTYFSPVSDTGWGFLIEQRRSDALGFFQSYFRWQTVLFALALLVPAGIVTYGVRHITEPIRQVTAASRQIAAGDLQQTIHVRTGDELEELANQFNRMSAQLHQSHDALVMDMIEQKRAEAALRKSEVRFRAVFEGAPIGIHVTSWDPGTKDWHRHKIEVNRAYQQILGYTADELARMHLEEYSHPDDAVADRALYREMLEGQREHYQIEKRYIARDGRVFWGRYSASMVRDAESHPQLMIGMVENIDDQKRAEQALQSSHQTLERRVKERTRELAVLNSIAAAASQSLDLKEIMRDALAQTIQYYGMDSGAAFELEEQTQTLVMIAHQGLPDAYAQKVSRLPLQVALAGKKAAGQPMVWQVIEDYPEGELKQSILERGIQSIFAIPLMAKRTPVGAFTVASKTRRVLTVEESALLAAVGQQVGVAMENARLYRQAQQTATTAERSRLARELHDSVTQSLYSVMLYAEAAVRSLADKEIPEASDYLKELRDTAQSALREMRLLIFELRPLALEKDGLVAALRARLNAVEGRGGMKTELNVDGSWQTAELPLVLQEELYHIAQEALNNVIRHAHAQSVAVRLQLSKSTIHLEIADDGIGFEASRADQSSGLGLRGMRERVQRIGGSLQITTAEGRGTRVTVQVPGFSATHDHPAAGGIP